MTDPKDKTEEKAPEKPLPVNKETVKDLSVQPEKEGDVVGGAGGTRSKPKTPANYTCVAC